ncbi:hypothetical protein [Bacillus paramycoides]|uniref:hypothetical protein n=1 Tax=Bacillus paramycoides TaxID=2026194 RepID=UPI003D0554BF
MNNPYELKWVLPIISIMTFLKDFGLGEGDIASPKKECYSKNRIMKGMMDE